MVEVLRGSHANGATPAKRHPTHKLHLPEEVVAVQEALYQVPGKNCEGQYETYVPDEPVAESEAELLCSGCPALQLCREYDTLAKPTYGVWGGVWRGDTN